MGNRKVNQSFFSNFRPSVVNLIKEYFAELERNDKTFDKISERRPSISDLQQAIDDNLYYLFVAYVISDNVPVGFVGTHFSYSTFYGSQAYISDLFVREESRGQNLGGKMIEFALKYLKENHNCTNNVLFTGPENEKYFDKLEAENVQIVEEFDHFVLPEMHFKNI